MKTESFRIAADILEQVRAAAKINGRSLRAEIERVLRQRFHSKPKVDGR